MSDKELIVTGSLNLDHETIMMKEFLERVFGWPHTKAIAEIVAPKRLWRTHGPRMALALLDLWRK